MFKFIPEPYGFEIAEPCGLSHDPQIIEVPMPKGKEGDFFYLEDEATGALYPLQRSKKDREKGFLLLKLDPFVKLKLRLREEKKVCLDANLKKIAGALPPIPCTIKTTAHSAVLDNGKFALEVPLGSSAQEGCYQAGLTAQGPVLRMRSSDGHWRGSTFLDTRRPVSALQGEITEEGPLRIVYQYQAAMAEGRYYKATITVDAGRDFARVVEEFSAGASDQVVWDFSGDDLPETMLYLDKSAGYRVQNLHYHFDQRLARLASWTQYSEQFGLSDGYGLIFPERDAVGFVALSGGFWRGSKLNFLEAWARRWRKEEPATRRELPYEAKADSFPSPERISARGGSIYQPHFNVEGWIGRGRREFALVLTQEARLLPPNWDTRHLEPALGHFETKPDRPRYLRQQGLLRKIHTQHGIFPLQEQVQKAFTWPEEKPKGAEDSAINYPHFILKYHLENEDSSQAQRKAAMMEYLQARVYGFWEGSGSAYTNCVVGRRIAPEMLNFEWLVAAGQLTPQEAQLCRAHFAFLIHLFNSDHYYPGLATMTPLQDKESTEPTLAGMANQNFYTDIINVFGMGAQVFYNHPEAPAWREKFSEMWHKQLSYHVYPQSGVWEESHTYYQHVLHTVLPLLLRRRADGVDDEFANPAMQKLVESVLKQITPKDAYFNNYRHLIPFGDHAVEVEKYRYLYKFYAEAFYPHAPRLAENLAWLYQQMGGEEPLEVPAKPIPWRNEYVQGLGMMFREVDPEGKETLLALRSGSAWGHHHNDEGSIQFFARGRALIVDAAFSRHAAGELKVSAQGHSRWTLRDCHPLNYLWRFNRGWLTEFSEEGAFPYAVAFTPVYMCSHPYLRHIPMVPWVEHYRIVVQLGANLYLIADCGDAEVEQVVRFHVPGQKVECKNNLLTADCPGDCRLQIVPLLPEENLLQVSATPLHLPEEEALYQTTEVAYDIGKEQLSVFLIWAGPQAEKVAVEKVGDGSFEIQALKRKISLEIAAQKELLLRSGDSGQERTIQLPLHDEKTKKYWRI